MNNEVGPTQLLFAMARQRHAEALEAAMQSRRARLVTRPSRSMRAGIAAALKIVGGKLIMLSESLAA